MKQKTSIYILLFVLFTSSIHAQSIYELNYQSPNNKHISPIHALMFCYSDGEGFIRLRFYDSVRAKRVILNLDLTDSLVIDKDGKEDNQLLIQKSNNPLTIQPINSIPFNPDNYLLKKDSITDSYFPISILESNDDTNIQFKQLSLNDLNESLMTQFFIPTEKTFQQIMSSQSRGSVKIPSDAVMHLIIVADTYDESIGYECTLDKKWLINIYSKIAASMQIPLDTIFLYGDNFKKSIIQKRIDDLKVGSNDLLFFHYTGHGFNLNNENDSFPSYFVENDKKNLPPSTNPKKLKKALITASINMAELNTSLQNKGARSTFIFSNCCNNTSDDFKNLDISVKGSKSRAGDIYDPNKCKALFYEQRYMVLSTAAKKTQLARDTKEYGGLFNYNYLLNLTTALSPTKTVKLDWKTILDQTNIQTPNIVRSVCPTCSPQNPMLHIITK
jgi:hypothetical protein